MADERPPVYREDGLWVIRASSFGACTTRLARHAAGMPGADVPQAIRDAWKFGQDAEPQIIRRLADETDWEMVKPGEMRKFGKVDRTGQLALELTVANRVTVRCHPDGIVRNRVTGEVRVLEVKTRARESSDPETDPFYAWQFSIEAAVAGLPVLLVVGWKVPGEGGEVRVLEDGPLDVREIDVKYRRAQIKARAILLARICDQAEKDGGYDEPCDSNDYPCPFYVLCGDGGGHGGRGNDGYVAVDDGMVELAGKLAGEYARYAAMEREAAEAKKAVRDEIADLVGEGKWAAGDWKMAVSVSDVPESTRTVRAHTRKTVKVTEGDG